MNINIFFLKKIKQNENHGSKHIFIIFSLLITTTKIYILEIEKISICHVPEVI